MTNTELKIQTVTGLIKRSPVKSKSHKYPAGSRSTRTTGVYAQKNWEGQIEVGYWTGGWSHQADMAKGELDTFIQFAQAQGYDFEWTGRFTLLMSKAA